MVTPSKTFLSTCVDFIILNSKICTSNKIGLNVGTFCRAGVRIISSVVSLPHHSWLEL